MPSDENPTVSAEASAADRDRQEGRDLGGDRLLAWRTQGTYERPQLRSLVAKHCEQLSSELVDVFRTEVEREVKQRVSEVIVSEATILCEQLRSKDEALLAAEARWKDLREEVELSNKMRSQLQERIGQLEATETELRAALNEQLEDRARVVPPPLESRHLALAYERKESRMLCRLCVDGHSRDETLPVISFGEDIKPSTLAWHIQRKHPQEYDVLLGMGEEELKEVAEEMSRVRG